MNPGTTIIIIIGIVTFLLYLSKALKPSVKEHFQVLSDTDISYKGFGKITEITKNAKEFNKMISAMKTPEFNQDMPPRNQIKNEQPALIVPTKNLIKDPIQKVVPVTESSVGTVLPVNTPASVLNYTPTKENKPVPEPFVSDTTLSPDKVIKHIEPRVETKIVYVNTKCPPPPDMSQYIRKDSIPCWGCNLR